MKKITLVYLIIAAVFLLVLIYASGKCSWKCGAFQGLGGNNEPFSIEDQQVGKAALEELEKLLSSGEPLPEVSDEELGSYIDDIYIVKLPSEDTKEKLSYFPTENTRYWPYYYYSFPYNYKYSGAWPPDMYSRLRYWSPGFYTGSGWSYYMRPGMGYKYWPRNRWIRKTQNGKDTYYYLSNEDNKIHDSSNYADTPLRFHS